MQAFAFVRAIRLSSEVCRRTVSVEVRARSMSNLRNLSKEQLELLIPVLQAQKRQLQEEKGEGAFTAERLLLKKQKGERSTPSQTYFAVSNSRRKQVAFGRKGKGCGKRLVSGSPALSVLEYSSMRLSMGCTCSKWRRKQRLFFIGVETVQP